MFNSVCNTNRRTILNGLFSVLWGILITFTTAEGSVMKKQDITCFYMHVSLCIWICNIHLTSKVLGALLFLFIIINNTNLIGFENMCKLSHKKKLIQ